MVQASEPPGSDPLIDIRGLHDPSEIVSAVAVLQQVWGSSSPIVGFELLRAIEHSGGYVAGAFDGDRMIGASFGWLARHDGRPALHSHITGILPGGRHHGVGRAIKAHQRAWARTAGIEWITWTFDPLVRRNAWFNIEVLGARIADYIEDFYGPMDDAVNGDDESDRLVAAWAVDPSTVDEVRTGSTDRIEVPTPDDIVVLRRTDPSAAHDWRLRVRAGLEEAMGHGFVVVGFTREGAYVLERGG
ncbi:MAG: hypothetical protein RIR49_1252 [Actinomycetota bacterium]